MLFGPLRALSHAGRILKSGCSRVRGAELPAACAPGRGGKVAKQGKMQYR